MNGLLALGIVAVLIWLSKPKSGRGGRGRGGRRHEPRVRKRRPKEYDLLNRPRNKLREALTQQGLTP